MKNLLMFIMFGLLATRGLAQVGVGTATPQAAIDVVSSDSGVLLPRVANTAAVTSPVDGMIVFDVSSKCFKGYQDGAWTGCGLKEEETVPEEVSPTGRIWMDRNLGASRVATSATDADAYGDMYQWGRGADGHQLRTSGTTPTLATSSTPGHGDFIDSWNDWLSVADDNLWQGVNGVNNPCPEGYRLPTATEWDNERAIWSSNDTTGAFASVLKLTAGGYRYGADIYDLGSQGVYWTSTISSSNPGFSDSLSFLDSNAWVDAFYRSYGASIRCIKD